MNTTNKSHNKSNTNLLSYQVRQELSQRGYSFLFNWSDYTYYRDQAKHAFNKAVAIAELFIQDTNTESDYNEYIF
jgi:hypothetical protein